MTVQKNREALTDVAQICQLVQEPTLWRLNVGIFILHMVLMAGFVVIPTILTDEMGIAGDNLWWIYLLLLGGGFVAMLPVMILGEKYRRQKGTFVGAVFSMALAEAVLSILRGELLTPIMLWLFFAAFNLLEASLPSWLSKVCPAGRRAPPWVSTPPANSSVPLPGDSLAAGACSSLASTACSWFWQ